MKKLVVILCSFISFAVFAQDKFSYQGFEILPVSYEVYKNHDDVSTESIRVTHDGPSKKYPPQYTFFQAEIPAYIEGGQNIYSMIDREKVSYVREKIAFVLVNDQGKYFYSIYYPKWFGEDSEHKYISSGRIDIHVAKVLGSQMDMNSTLELAIQKFKANSSLREYPIWIFDLQKGAKYTFKLVKKDVKLVLRSSDAFEFE